MKDAEGACRSRSSTDADSSLNALKSGLSNCGSCSLLKSFVFNRQRRNARRSEKKPKVSHAVKHHFKEAIDFNTYRLADPLAKYDRSVLKYFVKMAKQMTAQTESQKLIPFDPIAAIRVL